MMYNLRSLPLSSRVFTDTSATEFIFLGNKESCPFLIGMMMYLT